MKNYMKIAADAYRDASKLPLLTSARFETPAAEGDKYLHVSSVWSQTNLASYKSIKFSKSSIIDKTTLNGLHSSFATPIETISMSARQKDLRAVVKPGKEDSEQILEIWEKDFLRTSYNLKDIDAHGKVYCDDEFGGMNISEDLTKLVYVAEKKRPKVLPFLHQGEVGENVERGTKYDYREDWGEQLVDKVEPVVAVLDLTTVQPANIKIYDQIPGDLCPGKVVFWMNGIVGVAYKNQPRKLGKVYCSNRNTVLFYLNQEGAYSEIRSSEKLGGNEIGITGLTTRSETGRLCWFERNLNNKNEAKLYPGPHEGLVFPVVLDRLDGEPYIIDSSTSEVESWGGIFKPSMCERCWLDDDTFLISCPMQQTVVPVLINCKEKNISVLSEGNSSVHVHDVQDGFVVASKSDPVTLPHLVISRVDSLKFTPLFTTVGVEEFSWNQLTLQPEQGAQEGIDFPFKAFHIGSNEGSRPLIVWPHGGPHSVLTEDFNRTAIFFCKAGFNVLFVNYRGSLGFSEDFTSCLMGRIGDFDVKDCVLATEKCLEMFPNISKDKVFLMGGSHGGFLVTHLAGQYPDMFKGVVARNPVTNIASMCEVTDIPDWTFNESGVSYTFSNPQPGLYQEMWARSPISHVEKIKAPILLMIGKNDLRVPPSNGFAFYHTLKALGKNVSMHEYADNHPLAIPEHDANVMISAAIFFNNIINSNQK